MGQRQRVRLAMTFVHDPDLVLLDEPANSLDEEGLEVLTAYLEQLRRRGGLAVWCAPEGIQTRWPPTLRYVSPRGGFDPHDGTYRPRLPIDRPTRAHSGSRQRVCRHRPARRHDSYELPRVGPLAERRRHLHRSRVFYFISKLVHVPPFRSPGDYFAFAVVGIVVFGIVRSSLSIPIGVRQELVAGTYERLVLSPFGATAATASLMIFPILFAMAIAMLEVLVAVILFGMNLQWATAPLAMPIGDRGCARVRAVCAALRRPHSGVQAGSGPERGTGGHLVRVRDVLPGGPTAVVAGMDLQGPAASHRPSTCCDTS